MKRLALAAVLALAASSPWAARRFARSHLAEVTGRDYAALKPVGCLHCHRPSARTRELGTSLPPGPRYLSPEGLAVSPDGRILFVAAEGGGLVLQVDIESKRVLRRAQSSGGPHALALSKDGKRLAVSRRHADSVDVLDAADLHLVSAFAAGDEPLALAYSGKGELFVAEGASDEVCALGADGGPRCVVAGREPYAAAFDRAGKILAVANRMSRRAAPRAVPVSELTLVDAAAGRVAARLDLVSAHLSEGAALSSDGSFALMPVLRVRNLLPTTEVARGGLMNSALAFVEARPGGRVIQFPLDEVNAFFADPAGVALTPDDRLAFVAHGGADVVAAVDVAALRKLAARLGPAAAEAAADDLSMSPSYVLKRIPTLSNPRQLALSPDGSRLYVTERLADSVAVIDVRRLEVVDRIDLGGPRELTAARRGERRFHDGRATFQGQFSCRSCHPDRHTDALTWDFEIDGLGKGIVDTISLRGVKGTEPHKWNGKNPSLAVQCGPRFSRVLMRTEPFPPDQLADLVAFMETIPRAPRRLARAEEAARERGRLLFSRTSTNRGTPIPKKDRCDTCHPSPLYTIRMSFDVGTGGLFDVPHLQGVRYSAPYLHDGRARSLEEIWTRHNLDDTHGVTNDMTKTQLNDLVTFLRGL